MDKSNPKTELIQLHINVVINMLNVMLTNDEYFTIVINDIGKKYSDQFPEEAYVGDRIVLDIREWSFEQALLPKSGAFCTTVVYGTDSLYDISIDAIDIESIIIERMQDMPMYVRPFAVGYSQYKDETKVNQSEPLADWHNTKQYEEENKDAITKSMSCITLLKKDQ